MKIAITHACVVMGQRREIGDVVDVTDQMGHTLISMDRAAIATSVPQVQNKAVGLDGSEEKPKRRTRAKKKVESDAENDV